MEYKTTWIYDGENLELAINNGASDGWVLQSVFATPQGDCRAKIYLVFCRLK